MDQNGANTMNASDYNQVLMSVVQSVESLMQTCRDAAKYMDTTPSDDVAFQRDIDFLGKALVILEDAEPDNIEALWHDIQYLSRFLGGDYIRMNIFRDQFETGCDNFFENTLELIRCIRGDSKP